jgi:hypothetical protein
MTKDDIISWAMESGFADSEGIVHAAYQLEAFANLVAAAEREKCAQIVDDFGDEWMCDSHMLSKQIRARGNT